MNTLAIIQARPGGTRLPGKVRQIIGGTTMLGQVAKRVTLAGLPFLIAAPPEDLDESDVIGRFVRVAAKNPEAQLFVRITADCPLLDPGIVGYMVNLYRQGGCWDFAGTAPEMDGLDVEVFDRPALMHADLHTRGAPREHATRWMRGNLNAKIVNMAPAPLRWSVDRAEDLDFVRSVYAACPPCADGVPRHTNSATGIGGADRKLVIDLHQTGLGDLAECQAADLLTARMGGVVYVSPQ